MQNQAELEYIFCNILNIIEEKWNCHLTQDFPHHTLAN